jgi:hypothetical protein
MGDLFAGTTLWSVCPSGIVSQGKTDRALDICLILLQKALYQRKVLTLCCPPRHVNYFRSAVYVAPDQYSALDSTQCPGSKTSTPSSVSTQRGGM